MARGLRAGDLVAVWVPDITHEAIRDVVRARQQASHDVRKCRQRIQSYLLLRDKQYAGKAWTRQHRVWMSDQSFDHEAQQIAFQTYVNALDFAESRRDQLDQQLLQLLPTWVFEPVVKALQALRGIASVIAIALIAEIGDISRFTNPRDLMAYFGLVPGEHSSGSSVRPRGITKQGNSALRALLYEAAWCYRQGAKVGQWMRNRMPKDLPLFAKEIAWKAQLRLTSRYRKLMAKGKRSTVAVTAVARELLGFVWAIAKATPISNTTQIPAV